MCKLIMKVDASMDSYAKNHKNTLYQFMLAVKYFVFWKKVKK